jgi:hypothetical protein
VSLQTHVLPFGLLLRRRPGQRSGVDRQAHLIERRLDVEEAALDMAPLAYDGHIRRATVGNVGMIHVRHADILQDREGWIEQRPRTGNSHANHPDDHAGPPLPPIA